MNYRDYFGSTIDLNILLVTDEKQKSLVSLFSDIPSKSLEIKDVREDINLGAYDMVIVLLSFESFVVEGYNKFYSPFRKPLGFQGKYVFIRLDITRQSLMEGLSTDKEILIDTLNTYKRLSKKRLRISNQAGTDISIVVNDFKTCHHFIDDHSDMAFLPPSEIYAGIELGSAEGQIVVDVTIGDIYRNGQLLEGFGLVEGPVTLVVKNSRIVEITGCDRLKECLVSLEDAASVLVELGIGLSDLSPTGQIGIDECIKGTCHFGIGDGTFYNIDNKASIHLDLVISSPVIEEIRYEND
ncbi:hypothetical protein EZV73_23540 [Acidaminobacter sp. JC074]|uniref:hypothetical protein n=1 Tax=Acidaminobacter sp. JC074 TaxID=2530199 RepID=UPI001F0E148D|nr:hypothetical protein [Acidaminobacter sp. JC074]MCH4890575.1 hypothetical protein [Acidaminobacter sp. JC074]